MVIQSINNFWDVSVLDTNQGGSFLQLFPLVVFIWLHLFLNRTWYLRRADATMIMYFHDQQDL